MSNPTPRDPLTNATLSVPENERIPSAVPEAYRLRAHGSSVILQGAFRTWNAGILQHEWRDIPTVVLE